MAKARRKKPKSVFSQNLNEILKERGISLRLTAQLAEIPYTALHDWAAGGTSPSNLEAVDRLARELGVTFEFLCLGRELRPVEILGIEPIFEEQDIGVEVKHRGHGQAQRE